MDFHVPLSTRILASIGRGMLVVFGSGVGAALFVLAFDNFPKAMLVAGAAALPRWLRVCCSLSAR